MAGVAPAGPAFEVEMCFDATRNLHRDIDTISDRCARRMGPLRLAWASIRTSPSDAARHSG